MMPTTSIVIDQLALALLCPQERFVLVQQRHGDDLPPSWVVPGGLVEAVELILDALARAEDRDRSLRDPRGRFSTIRKLAGLTPIQTASPIDVLWFRLSRRPDDPDEALLARVGHGLFVVCIDRFEYWQVGCVIPKGGYQDLRRAGLTHLRQALARIAPEWADRLHEIQSWQQIAVLSVEASRLKRWYRPGLLLIGDAAHVMSPVGGVGINYAIQDAVVAANVLSPKLRQGLPIGERDLAAVQRQRELPIRFIQFVQSRAQNAVFAQILNGRRDRVFVVPRIVRPLLRASRLLAFPARLLSFGLCPPQVQVGQD